MRGDRVRWDGMGWDGSWRGLWELKGRVPQAVLGI